jgi:hypothetical protein
MSCKAKSAQTCPRKLTTCHHDDDGDESPNYSPTSPSYSPTSPTSKYLFASSKPLHRKRKSKSMRLPRPILKKKDVIQIEIEEHEKKRNEHRKQVEEKKKLITSTDPAEQKAFRYYMDSKVRNPIFLEIKDQLENKFVAVEESLVSSVSSVWKEAMSLDKQAIVLPIDAQFDEDVVRCAIYLAGTLFYKQAERLAKVKLDASLLLKVIAFSFQLGMNELHDWLLIQVVPSPNWSMEELLKLYKSDLHTKGGDFFSPIPREIQVESVIDSFFGDDSTPLAPKEIKQKPKQVGWLKQECARVISSNRQGILDHVLQKTQLAPDSVEADLLRLGMNLNENLFRETNWAMNFYNLLWMEMDGRPWCDIIRQPNIKEFVRTTYLTKDRRPDEWKLVINACSGKFRAGVTTTFSPEQERLVKNYVGL